MIDADLHSRLIGWLKIALPLLALAILSTLFLIARTVDPDDAIPYAEVDVAERLREPRMTAPTYAGLTNDGAALTISAGEVRPVSADGSGATASVLSGTLETPDGGRTDLTAAAGKIDTEMRQILLSGGVTVTSSTGWRMESEALTAAMDVTDISSPTFVTATGPGGTVTADRMRLTEDAAQPGRYLLVFNGAVKLIYQPAN
ncbi:MAG: LPS export ABC transporter periplasmic protein LptC [Paracoccaceae bacterium]